MKIYAITSALLGLTLTACATTGPSILSANDAGITIKVRADQVDKAEAEAETYCESKGRTAVLDRVTPAGKDANVSFYCR